MQFYLDSSLFPFPWDQIFLLARGGVVGWRSIWNFQLTESFQPHYGPGVDTASNRNVYKESSWG
jgi:hypothetical protein